MDEDKNPPNKDKNRMIETYEEIVQRYGEPIFRHRFGQDYDFKGKNDYDLIPTEIIIIRHSNEIMGGVMIFTNYQNKNQWHVNDSAGNRFFIREVLNGRIKVDPIPEPWVKLIEA